MEVEIDLFEHQEAFLSSKAKHTGLIAGYGSGKSFVAIFKTFCMMAQGANNVAYYLPTYGLIRDVAIPKFIEFFESYKIKYSIRRQDKDIITPYGLIHLRSMSDPDSIIGYEVGYSLIDEADILPTNKMREVFERIIARNRMDVPEVVGNRTDVVGTPEGFKWAYEFFVTKATEDKAVIHGKTTSNIHLPESYISNLKKNLSDQQIDAYMNGMFVNLTSGTVYTEFDRDKHCKVEDHDIKKLHIGMDFNIGNMAAVIASETKEGRHIFDEFTGVYDTHTMATLISKKYPNSKIYVYPDAAGGARNTAGKSDHDILRKAGFQVFSLKQNPIVRDRINKVNQYFREGKISINPNTCTELVRALEIQAYDKNGVPDKSSGVDHQLDALGYLICNNTRLKLL